MKVKIAIISLLVLCLMSGVAYAEKRPIIMVTGGGGSVADATTTTKGKVELATDAEAIAGTSDAVVMTPGNTTAVLAEAQDLTITGGTIKDITSLSVAGPATITTHLAVGATPDPDTYTLTVGGPAHYTGTVTTTGNIISGGNFSKVGSGTFLSGYSNNFNVGISGGGQTTMTSFNTNSFVFQARGYDFLDDYAGTAGPMYIQGPVSIGAGLSDPGPYSLAVAGPAHYTGTVTVTGQLSAPADEIAFTADLELTVEQLSGSIITYSPVSAGTDTLTLCTLSEGLNTVVIAALGDGSTYTVNVDPQDDEIIILDGTALDAGDKVQWVVNQFDSISIIAFEYAGDRAWLVETRRGVTSDGGS